MLRSLLASCAILVLSFAQATAQDVTYDSLTLDDGSGTIPIFRMEAGSGGSVKTYRVVAFSSGLGFYQPTFSSPTVWMTDEAPPTSLFIDDLGIGIGTQTPMAPLHIRGNGSTNTFNPFPNPWIYVQDASPTVAHRVLMVLSNNGGSSIRLENTSTGHSWQNSVLSNGDYRISLDGSGGHEFRLLRNGRLVIGPGNKTVFDLKPNGNLIISGSLSQSSDRNQKENFDEADCQKILEQLTRLPIQTWNYKFDDDTIRHIGPMAQDFYREFQVGQDSKTISTVDTAGVTMAAIKALAEKNQHLDVTMLELIQTNREQKQKIEELEQSNVELEERILALESALLSR